VTAAKSCSERRKDGEGLRKTVGILRDVLEAAGVVSTGTELYLEETTKSAVIVWQDD
jgi:hypothetical protein